MPPPPSLGLGSEMGVGGTPLAETLALLALTSPTSLSISMGSGPLGAVPTGILTFGNSCQGQGQG